MKVRTMEEIHEDPARVRVTVDVELSAPVGTAAQANRIQVLEAELEAALVRARSLEEGANLALNERDRLTGVISRVRESVWAGELDEAVEHRGQPEAIAVELVGRVVASLAYVRATLGQP